MLEEQLEIVQGLWTEPDGWSYDGAHWQVRDARFYPKPVAPRAAAIRTSLSAVMAARAWRAPRAYADEINTPAIAGGGRARAFENVRAACAAGIGRDPGRR